MSQSNGKFIPPNVFSEMVWNAVWSHIKKQNTTNIIGIYNCKIFYSTYVSLISSYSNLTNTNNVEIYLTKGLESFFQWAKINNDRFKSDSESFISYFSHELIDPYINHFSRLFFNEIKVLEPRYSLSYRTPYFMLLFDVDSPKDDKEIYDEEYFFDSDIEPSRIEEFYEIIHSNFEIINTQFDLLLGQKDNLKLANWPVGKVGSMISDRDFFEKLVIKPFNEARCQICGNFTLREERSLNVDVSEGWILPMCPKCKQNNL
jgi:hypothetical protein